MPTAHIILFFHILSSIPNLIILSTFGIIQRVMQDIFVGIVLKNFASQVSKAFSSVANSTILGNYNLCREKMTLYRARIDCGSLDWRHKTSHQKLIQRRKIVKIVGYQVGERGFFVLPFQRSKSMIS